MTVLASAEPVSPGAMDPGHAPATLTIWNRPIIVLRARVNQVDPAARVATAVQRFNVLPDDVRGDELRTAPATVGDLHGVVVAARNYVLFGIVEGDVDPTAGETVASVSEGALAQLRAAIDTRAQQRRPLVIARGVGISVGAALLLVLLLWAIRRATDRLLSRVAEATHRRAISTVGVDVRRPLIALERGLLKVAATGLALVAAYLWLAVSLRSFPYTRPWSDQLRANLLGLLAHLGSNALEAVPGLFVVALIFMCARFVARLLETFFRAVEHGTITLRAFRPDTAWATRQIMTVLVWLFALTVAYEYIPGSNTEAFKAVGVVVGVVISLGSAGLVNQLMSGLVVVYSRALRTGEVVRTGDRVGRVAEVGLVSTKIVTMGEEITIPNAVLVGSTVTNYSRLGGAGGPLVSTAVTIGYDAPWRQVHAMLQMAAERTARIRRDPPPIVLQRALSDFYVDYELRAHFDPSAEYAAVLAELHGHIQDVFNDCGVQIMSPHFRAQPEHPIVVPRSKWHTAPAVPAAERDDRTKPTP